MHIGISNYGLKEMTILLVFFIFILILCFSILRYIKLSLFLQILNLVFFIIIGNGVILPILVDTLQKPNTKLTTPSWKANNLIILLGGGIVKISSANEYYPGIYSYGRIFETARLYFLCKEHRTKCNIMISGGDPSHKGKTEAAIYEDALIGIGINKKDLITENLSRNTFENAKFVKRLIEQYSYDNIILVTSAIHMKRSLLYFNYYRIFPTPANADYIYPELKLLPRETNFIIFDQILHEYLGICQFFFKTIRHNVSHKLD